MDNPNTYVSYGDFGFKGDGFTTPYVSRTQTPIYYGVRSGQISEITLQGQITGLAYEEIISTQARLISGFSKDFQSLDLREKATDEATELTSVAGFPLNNCIVNSINFGESKYTALLDYSISIRGYDPSLFSGVSKVTEPVNSFSFADIEDGTVSVSHEISAVGINTKPSGTMESNALDNAKSFVLSLTGWNNQVLPELIKKNDGSSFTSVSPSLVSQVENVNRMNGNFSVTENWEFDKDNRDDFSRKVTVDIDSGINADFVVATVRAEYRGSKQKSMAFLRNAIHDDGGIKKELYEIAADNFDAFKGDVTRKINPEPRSFDVKETEDSRKISISAIFSDSDLHPYKVINFQNTPEGHPSKQQNYAYFDYSVDLSKDEIRSSTQVTIKGSVVGIGGDLKNRYSGAYNFVDDLHNAPVNSATPYRGLSGFLYWKAKGVYDIYYSGISGFGLNQRAMNISVDYNEYAGRVDLSADFNDDDQFLGQYRKNDKVSYSIKVKPTIPMISSKPIISTTATIGVGEVTKHEFFDLRVNKKTEVSISCNVKPEKGAYFYRENLVEEAKTDAYNLRKVLKQLYVDEQAIKSNTNTIDDSASFIKINSDKINYDKFLGDFSLSSSYSFNDIAGRFVKRPSNLFSNEDPLAEI